MDNVQCGICGICGITGLIEDIQEHFDVFHVENFGDEVESSGSTTPQPQPQPSSAQPSEILADGSEEGNVPSIKRWSDSETILIISLYKENEGAFQSAQPNKNVWKKIAIKFKEYGYSATGDQCESKMKNLRKTYKTLIDSNKKTGRGRLDWPYYDAMQDIFGNKPDIRPISVASSSGGFRYLNNTPAPASCTASSPRNSSSPEMPPAPVSQCPLEVSGPGKNGRKRKSEDTPKNEPVWFTEYKKEQEIRHKERMKMQESFLDVFKKMADGPKE